MSDKETDRNQGAEQSKWSRPVRAVEAKREALLVFRVGVTWLGVDANQVEELCEPLPLTPLPRVPHHIPGMISLRGQPIPLLDLERFLRLPRGARIDEDSEVASSRYIVVRAQSMTVGLLCDRASRVAEVESDSIQELEVIQGEQLRTYCRGEIDLEGAEGLVAVLDLSGLLQAARVRG